MSSSQSPKAGLSRAGITINAPSVGSAEVSWIRAELMRRDLGPLFEAIFQGCMGSIDLSQVAGEEPPSEQDGRAERPAGRTEPRAEQAATRSADAGGRARLAPDREAADALRIYLRKVDAAPKTSRQDEFAAGERIAAGERAVLDAVLATPLAARRWGNRPGEPPPDEEVEEVVAEIGRAVREGGASAERRARVEAETGASLDELRRALEAIRRGEAQAAEAKADLVQSHLRNVVYLARRFGERGLPLLDLIQEGNIGLMTAANKFDHRLGYRFATYANYWIRQSMRRALGEQGRTVRLPPHRTEALGKLARTRRRLGQELRREPTVEELAAALELPAERVRHLIEWSAGIVSLETPVGDEGDAKLADLLANPAAEVPAAAVMASELSSRARAQLGVLSDREREVLTLRFGMNEDQELTLEEIGRRFGVTRERIRQIEARALSKLRHPSRSRALQGLLGA